MYDLLEIDNDIVKYTNEIDKSESTAIFEDNDDLFSRYRFRHIAEVK
jgi:hypothetical protein